MILGGATNKTKQQIALDFWYVEKNRAIFLEAICTVESNCDSSLVGESGELGAFQIMEDYWIDSEMPGSYQDVVDDDYAKACMYWYFHRYARKALFRDDYQTLARIHNGGPNGCKKSHTVGYWNKVKATIKRIADGK